MKDLTIKEIGKINFGHKNSSWHIQAPLSYIQQNDSSFLLKVDNNTIGFNLEVDDEFVAFGKFNS